MKVRLAVTSKEEAQPWTREEPNDYNAALVCNAARYEHTVTSPLLIDLYL